MEEVKRELPRLRRMAPAVDWEQDPGQDDEAYLRRVSILNDHYREMEQASRTARNR